MNEELQDAIADLADLRKKLLAEERQVPGMTFLALVHHMEDKGQGLLSQYLTARTIVQRREQSEKPRELTIALKDK